MTDFENFPLCEEKGHNFRSELRICRAYKDVQYYCFEILFQMEINIAMLILYQAV